MVVGNVIQGDVHIPRCDQLKKGGTVDLDLEIKNPVNHDAAIKLWW